MTIEVDINKREIPHNCVLQETAGSDVNLPNTKVNKNPGGRQKSRVPFTLENS